MYSINTNLSAMSAANSMDQTNSNMNVLMQQLSTGTVAVNAATSDSNYALSVNFTTQSQGLNQAMANAQTGVNYLNVMTSSVKETTQLLQKMKVLSTQAQNAGYTSDNRTQMNDEFKQLKAEIDRNASSAKFNGQSLINDGPGGATAAGQAAITATDFSALNTKDMTFTIDGVAHKVTFAGLTNRSTQADVLKQINTALGGNGAATIGTDGKLSIASTKTGTDATIAVTASTAGATLGVTGNIAESKGTAGTTATFHVGYNTDAQNDITVNSHNLTSTGLGVNASDISTAAGAATASDDIDAALVKVNNATSEFGAISNRLGFTTQNLSSIKQNTDHALSNVQDTNYAQATTDLAKQKVLQQAASAMLTQANQAPQQAIQLLKG